MELVRRRNSVTNLQAHLIFSTKYRRKLFNAHQIECLRSAMESTCEKLGCDLVEIDGEQDHVHLLIRYPPKLSISVIVNSLKATSSRRLRQKYPHLRCTGKALWSRSYFACSVGGAPIEVLRKYIGESKHTTVIQRVIWRLISPPMKARVHGAFR